MVWKWYMGDGKDIGDWGWGILDGSGWWGGVLSMENWRINKNGIGDSKLAKKETLSEKLTNYINRNCGTTIFH
jgi:hypothetical protein